jgi:hypothetical protein
LKNENTPKFSTNQKPISTKDSIELLVQSTINKKKPTNVKKTLCATLIERKNKSQIIGCVRKFCNTTQMSPSGPIKNKRKCGNDAPTLALLAVQFGNKTCQQFTEFGWVLGQIFQVK